ncbi:MAG TPA: PilZ domain-containing protein, partial [Alphaproteobacteria bacterium]
MKSYEELPGAVGRRVFYRAERFEARDLFPRCPPRVRVDGTTCNLENISMTGLAANIPAGSIPPLGIGEEIDVTLECDGSPLFASKARLCRLESRELGGRLALSFAGFSLDIPGLVARHNESLVKSDLNGGLHHALDLVAPDYRQHCADVLHVLRRYRATLERFESNMRRHNERMEAEHLDALYSLAEERM